MSFSWALSAKSLRLQPSQSIVGGVAGSAKTDPRSDMVMNLVVGELFDGVDEYASVNGWTDVNLGLRRTV